MSRSSANGGKRSYKALFENALWSLASFVVPFLTDTAISSTIFAGLLWFGWLVGLGRAYGMKQEHLEAIAVLHFWLNYGLFVGIGMAFLWRTVKRIFGGD